MFFILLKKFPEENGFKLAVLYDCRGELSLSPGLTYMALQLLISH